MTSSTKTNCTCDGSGYILLDDNTFSFCVCRKQQAESAKMERLFRSARIPKRYQGKTLDMFAKGYQDHALKIACAYANRWPQESGLLFVGHVGTGKTHLAIAMQNELIAKHHISSLTVSVPDLMDDLRGHDESKEQMKALKEVDLLVLDDLGAQKNTDWVTERLYVIINARYSELRPTIITSNSYLSDLNKIAGWERIVDRIIECCHVIKCEGASYRKKTKGEVSK